jgi:hypothetical protein
MVRVLAFRFTVEPLVPLREATDWLSPRASVELPLIVTALSVLVGRASAVLAFRVAPLMMNVGPL